MDKKEKAYMIIWGQCDDGIRNKIEAHPGYKKIDENRDLMELVKVLEEICCSFETTTQGTLAIALAWLKFATFAQDISQGNVEFYEEFKARLSTLENYGGELGAFPGIVKKILEKDKLTTATANAAQIAETEAENKAKDEFQAALLLLMAN